MKDALIIIGAALIIILVICSGIHLINKADENSRKRVLDACNSHTTDKDIIICLENALRR